MNEKTPNGWEKVQFKDLYYKVSEKNDLTFGKDKIISVANMYYNSSAKITDNEYLKTYNIFRLGDIAFEGNKNKNFAYGRFVENTIGDGIVSHIFDVFRPLTNLNLLYWKYAINYENVMGKILKRCTKSATMMTNLVANDFLKEFINVPPIEEQQKIAEILSTQDKLIELKQKLIDQKKLRKKWLMQNLLTGKIRLKGFSEEWKQVKLGDISEVNRGGSPRPINKYITTNDNGINWIKIGDTDLNDKYITSAKEKIIPEGIRKSRYVSVGDFLLSNSMSYGRPYILKINGCIHDGWLVISKYNQYFILDYFYYSLCSESVKKQYDALSAGSGVQNLNKDLVSQVTVKCPPIEEQTEIAEILSQQDKEIELLEKELELQKQKKKVLMQLLLTGKVRTI